MTNNTTLTIECEPKQVVQKTTDRRGRLTLGKEYGDQEVTVLVVEPSP